MTDSDLQILKDGILSIEKVQGKSVRVTCIDKETGKNVAVVIANNYSEIYSEPYEKEIHGINYKDFRYKFDKEWKADGFKSGLERVIQIKIEYPPQDTGGGETPDVNPEPSGTDPSLTLFVVAGIIILLSFGVVLWKRKK